MKRAFHKEQVPWLVAGVRAFMGPLMIAGQICRWNRWTLAGIIVAALVSDIFDGMLARRWKCDTNGVRLFDSMADTVFYIGTAVALWMREPQIVRTHGGLLLALASLEVARFAFDFAKFGKPASYHSYLAKTWGLILAIAVVVSFLTAHAGALIAVALWLGIFCDAEGLSMSLILSKWRKDVKTISMALRIRLMECEWCTPEIRATLRMRGMEPAR